MNDKNQNRNEEQKSQSKSDKRVINPFENNRSADDDIQQSQEELDKEQEFKEAMTERD